MYRVDDLRPEIPGTQVTAIDALVESVDRNKDSTKPIRLNQRTRRTLNSPEHSLALLA
jgi:hypothetical protein